MHLSVHPRSGVHHDPKGHGAHRVADVRELLLSCDVQHVIDHGWKILLTHLVKGELPKLLSGRIENCMLSAVSISSEVAHPHVIASVREDETCQSEWVITDIDYSGSSRISQHQPSALSLAPRTQSTEEQSSPC